MALCSGNVPDPHKSGDRGFGQPVAGFNRGLEVFPRYWGAVDLVSVKILIPVK